MPPGIEQYSVAILITAAIALAGWLITGLVAVLRLGSLRSASAADAVISAARLESSEARVQQLENELAQRAARIDQLQQECANLRTRHAELLARHSEASRAAADKLSLLEQTRERMNAEFSTLANRIFQEKVDRFARDNKSSLELTLTPLRDQLTDFRRRVEEVYSGDTEGRVKLLHEIVSLKDLNRQMSEEAVNLTRALKGDNKVQGGWGEVILERILEESGLQKGREYETQVASLDAAGQKRLPDVIVRLPEGRDVIIDSKVSLRDYEQYCSAGSDAERADALRAHVRSLRTHIESLSVKDYAALEGVRSLDFVLVFVPIEAAFMAALDAEPALFSRAFERHIIMVSPTTLLVTLRTIQSIWRYERQSRNAEEIARRAGALHDQFARVLEALEDLGRHLGRTKGAYDLTVERFTRGRGNLVNRVAELERLGARSRKTLPEALLAAADSDPDSDTMDASNDQANGTGIGESP